MEVPYTFTQQQRNILRMGLIYLKADYDDYDLEDLSTDGETLEKDCTRLIDDFTPASWDSIEGDDPHPSKDEIKAMQKEREESGNQLRLFPDRGYGAGG